MYIHVDIGLILHTAYWGILPTCNTKSTLILRVKQHLMSTVRTTAITTQYLLVKNKLLVTKLFTL